MRELYSLALRVMKTKGLVASLRLLALLPLLALASSCVTVVTSAPTAVTTTSAQLGGTATATSSTTTIASRGVVYSTTEPNPNYYDPSSVSTRVQIAGPGNGTFSQVVTGLQPNTRYYVAAYVTANDTQQGSGAVTASATTFVTRGLLTPPVVTTPANGSTVTTARPAYTGTAVAGSTVTVYVDGTSVGQTVAVGGSFSVTQPSNLPNALHTVYATAQTPGAGTSADSNTNTFTVNAVQPPTTTISSTAAASGGSTTTGTIPFTVTFADPVTGFVGSDVVVTNGTVVNFAGSGATYTFDVTATAYGAVTVNVPANSATGGNGLGNAAASPYTITYLQPVTPTPVVTYPTNNSWINTTTPTYTGTAAPNSTVTVLVDSSTPILTTADGSGNWSLNQSTALTQGSHTVNARAQAPGQLPSNLSPTTAFFVDSVVPGTTVTSSTANNGSSSSASTFSYTVIFSEAVTGFLATDVTVANGTVTGFVANSNGYIYTFDVAPAAPGPVTFSVPANVAQDRAANGNTASLPYVIVYAVTAAPVVTLPANGGQVNTTTPTYSGTAPANSTVTVYVDGSLATLTTADGSGNWSVSQPTALAPGSHTVRATAQSINAAVSADSNTNTFVVDLVPPTVDISSTAGANGAGTATTPIPFTVTFLEAVTGFVASDVSVSNGSIITGSFSGSGTTYTFTVTPTTAGTATTVSVPANVAQDPAGNGNTAATPFSLTFVPTATTWTGNVSSDWFDAGNWTAGVPTATIDATIPTVAARFPVLTTGTATAKNLTVAASAAISHTGGTLDLKGDFVQNGTYNATGTTATMTLSGAALQTLNGAFPLRFVNLTVGAAGAAQATAVALSRVLSLSGNLATNGNPLTLLSSSAGDALVVNNGGVVNGTATVQRFIDPSLNAGRGYRHYSAPVSNTTVADLATSGFTPVVNPTYNTAARPDLVTNFPTVFGYDQARIGAVGSSYAPFDQGWFSPAALTDALTVGRGYTVNLDAAQLVDFTGTLNNGNVTVAMASNRSSIPDGGWHLVGNPYPAPLNYSLVAPADRTGMDGAIYVYSSTSQYNGQHRAFINGIGGNPVIPSGQGFFARVAAGQASGQLTFRNSQRLTTPNGTSFQRTTAESRPLVHLTLRGVTGVATDEAYVYAEAGATAGYDPAYDAEKLPNTTGLNLSAAITGRELAINGLPAFTSGTIVPLTVGVPAAGAYALQVAQLLNLPAGTAAVLVDAQLGTRTDLAALPAAGYTFTVSPAQAAAPVTGRFFLNLAAAAPLATAAGTAAPALALYPNPTDGRATTLTGAPAGATVTVFDALGRSVLTTTASAAGTAQLALPAGTATGVYVLRTGTRAIKLVVE